MTPYNEPGGWFSLQTSNTDRLATTTPLACLLPLGSPRLLSPCGYKLDDFSVSEET